MQHQHAVKHDLTLEMAKHATNKAWEAYAQRFAKYSPKATWTSDRHADVQFTVRGVTVRGGLELTEDEIWMTLEVPLVFRPFRKMALEIVEEEIRTWVAKAKAGEI